jgi:hypothetical protein
VNGFLPIVLLAVAGVLLGGAYSLLRQGASRGAVGVVGLLGVVSAIGGVLWLIPDA